MLKANKTTNDILIFKPANPEPIVFIAVAATFTTLSIANNGGNTQITSAGIHGLTTSPAVGASVYVTWSGGTGVNGFYSVLSVDSTTAITINLAYGAGLGTPSVALANTAVGVYTFNLPVLPVGAEVRVNLFATHTNSANGKTYGITVNGTAMVSAGISTGKDYLWINQTVYRNSNVKFNSGFIGYGATSSGSFSTPTIDTTINNTYGFTVRPAVANETISIQALTVEVFV